MQFLFYILKLVSEYIFFLEIALISTISDTICPNAYHWLDLKRCWLFFQVLIIRSVTVLFWLKDLRCSASDSYSFNHYLWLISNLNAVKILSIQSFEEYLLPFERFISILSSIFKVCKIWYFYSCFTFSLILIIDPNLICT